MWTNSVWSALHLGLDRPCNRKCYYKHNKDLSEHVFSVLWVKCLGAGLWGLKIILYLTIRAVVFNYPNAVTL